MTIWRPGTYLNSPSNEHIIHVAITTKAKHNLKMYQAFHGLSSVENALNDILTRMSCEVKIKRPEDILKLQHMEPDGPEVVDTTMPDQLSPEDISASAENSTSITPD